jgi:hypothetical protein
MITMELLNLRAVRSNLVLAAMMLLPKSELRFLHRCT